MELSLERLRKIISPKPTTPPDYTHSKFFDEDLSGGKINLNENTLRGFLLTGKFVPLDETHHSQFNEKPLWEQSTRTAAPDYAAMKEVHLADGDVGFALDLHNAVISGRGFHIGAKIPELREKIMDFAKLFHLREFCEIAVKEALGYGSTFFKYKNPDNYTDLVWLSISSIKAVWWEGDFVKEYEVSNRYQRIPASEMLHIPWRRIDASPFGHGLIEPLITSRDYSVTRDQKQETRTRPAIMEVKAEMQDSGRKILQRYLPRAWINLKGHGPLDEIAKKFRSKLKTLEPEEDVISPIEAEVIEQNRNTRAFDWESWEKLFRNEIITALENPAIRIFTEPGFTKANADAAVESVKMLLQGFADYMEEIVLQMIIRPYYEQNPWLDALGQKVEWKDTGIEFHWGPMEVPEIKIEDLVSMGALTTQGFPALKPEEFRRIAKNVLGWPLDEDTPKPMLTAPTTPGAPPEPNVPLMQVMTEFNQLRKRFEESQKLGKDDEEILTIKKQYEKAKLDFVTRLQKDYGS